MAGSLLEVFGIVFESDADEVKKGAEQAKDATEGLEDALGDADKRSGELGNTFMEMLGSAEAAIGSILGLGAITAGVITTAAMTDEIGKFSQTLGLNISEVAAWREAVIRSGGDVNGFTSSIEGLTRGLADFAITGGGTAFETLSRIGINATDAGGKVKDAFQILPELADAFENLAPAEAAGLGERLGLDQGTILLLQQGRRAVEDLVQRQRDLGVATQEDYEIAARFNDQWSDTKQVFSSLFITSGSTILPMLTMILSGVEKFVFFLADHEALVSGFFIGISAIIAGVYGPAIGAAAIATITAIAPFILMGAAIAAAGAAIALIVDDIYNFVQGNDSLIGQVAEKYPQIGRLINLIGDFMSRLIELAGDAGEAIAGAFDGAGSTALGLFTSLLDGLFTLMDGFIGLLFRVGDALVGVFNNPQESIENLITSLKEFASNLADLIPNVDEAVGKVKEFFDFGDDDEEVEVTKTVSKNITQSGDDAEQVSGRDPDVPPSDFIEVDVNVEQEPFNPLENIKADSVTVKQEDNASATLQPNNGNVIDLAAMQKKMEGRVAMTNQAYTDAQANPLNGQTSTSISTANQFRNSSNTVSINSVVVQTQATDADGIAREVGSKLSSELEVAMNQIDDGVKV